MFGWLKPRPLSDMLEKANIPTASGVVADLLILRIAQLDDSGRVENPESAFFMEEGSWFWYRRLDEEHGMEIRCTFPQSADPMAVRRGQLYWINAERAVVTVGIPGPPKYRTVDLSRRDQTRVAEQVILHRQRIEARQALEKNAASEAAALDLIEKLI